MILTSEEKQELLSDISIVRSYFFATCRASRLQDFIEGYKWEYGCRPIKRFVIFIEEADGIFIEGYPDKMTINHLKEVRGDFSYGAGYGVLAKPVDIMDLPEDMQEYVLFNIDKFSGDKLENFGQFKNSTLISLPLANPKGKYGRVMTMFKKIYNHLEEDKDERITA